MNELVRLLNTKNRMRIIRSIYKIFKNYNFKLEIYMYGK
jgi:hypothetical protein